MLSQIIWRYRRHRDVLYIRAEHHAPDRAYRLICRYPNGTSRAIHLSSLAMLHDHLRVMEDKLGADGWEQLPADQRAPNRLPTPICATCWPQRAIETTQRSVTHVYFRCTGCDHKWTVAKPGIPPEPAAQQTS